ncbi:MAG: glycosyltransferase family 4 protein [Nitrospinae bacterium]|nr:glycosyltransferase family 4 protein [Nitrospinota bacterium]
MVKKKIAVFATEPVTGNIGGLGIRQLEVARELHRKGFSVRLITPFPVGEHREKFPVEHIQFFHHPALAEEPLRWADALYASQPSPHFLRLARDMNKPVAVDLLALLYFEELERLPVEQMGAAEQGEYFSSRAWLAQNQLALGDFFLCSNERERDYYLGCLTQLGKLPPDVYPRDPLFRSIIDIAPFGIPRRAPRRGKNRLRGVVPGIEKYDFILLWGGSLWNWYDCITPVKAMTRLLRKCPKAKLVFLGTQHPATSKPTEAYLEVKRYAEKHKLLGKNVFFHSQWVPYGERDHFLTESDAGVATFRDHIENRFSFRIRLTDCLWANLPIITNPGNTVSGLIEGKNLGVIVPFGDDKAVADAVAWMAAHPAEMKKMRQRVASAKTAFHWDRVLAPLMRFFKNPQKRLPVFHHALARLSFTEFNRRDFKRVLFLRSAPMPQCAEALKAVRSIAPHAAIDLVIQPGTDAAALGGGLNLIPLPENGFRPEHAALVAGKEYDLVLCAFNTNDMTFYANVAAFANNVVAGHYWAFGHDGHFMDIRPLMSGGGIIPAVKP